MASIISTKTSGGGGIAVTGDTSGVLELQSNNGTTAVTIDASQNVGIGTASPATKLHCSASSVFDIRVQNTAQTNQYMDIGTQTSLNAHYLYGYGSYPMLFATNATERMRIDSSGRVTMPYQPAFFARKTNGGAMSPVNPVLFNDIVTNIGSYYNASTGRFTAPVAGTYYFISTAHCETTNNVARALVIYVNGVNRAYGYILNATGARTRIVTAAILTLAANDYVTIGTDTSDFWAGDSSGINFMGYLIG